MNNAITTIDHREQTAQFVWTGFIIAFFVIQAILWTVAITFTSNDSSHAVVEGYDEKALHWDEQVAAQAASDRLGWKCEITIDPRSDVRGFHAIQLAISDDTVQTVSGASAELTAFHQGHAGEPQVIALNEIEDGIYSGEIRVHKSGLWRFTGTATKKENCLLFEEIQTVKASR